MSRLINEPSLLDLHAMFANSVVVFGVGVKTLYRLKKTYCEYEISCNLRGVRPEFFYFSFYLPPTRFFEN